MSIALEFHAAGRMRSDALTADAWRSDAFDFWVFDRRVDRLAARGEPLHVIAAAGEIALLRRQLAIRTQRVGVRRNAGSRAGWFTRVLIEHRAQHDLRKPLVQADLDLAIDTWQWTLRLDPEAPAAVQLAALLHDVERLASEPEQRREHLAADYQAFKDAHATAGAAMARTLLDRASVPAEIADQTCALIAVHERAGDSPDLCAVNDADALSFFSLNSPGYLAYFGPEQTAKKVAYTYRRMSDDARGWLGELRMPALVRDEVHRCDS
jgi:hypothetical protein